MARKRRQHSNQFKFKVALEASKGLKTLNEIASGYNLHPNQVSSWKRQLLEGGPAVFGSNVAWQLSNTLDGAFCLDALRLALRLGQPEIFNTDQGVQFTAHDFVNTLEAAEIRVSMDGRGRVFDNIFVERLWRTVKYEDIYIKQYDTVPALAAGLHDYFHLYNYERPHQSLGYCVPADVHFAVKVPIL